MPRKQLIALFTINFVFFTSGIMLVSLLPIYATRLGADSASAGYLLSVAFFALAVSTIAGGWLADRFQRRKLILMVGAVLIVPLVGLMSVVTTVSALAVLMSAAWFVGGLSTAMIGILAGMFAGEHERGRVFGLLGLSVGLAGILGNFASGRIVDRWGYPALFIAAALVYAIAPIAALFVEDRVVPRPQPQITSRARPNIFASRTFLLLFCASVLIHVANSQIGLAKPLLMDTLRFDATAISTAGAVGSVIGLPLPFLVGWLSDRLGRKPFIILCYLTQAACLVMLTSGSLPWQFWIISALQGMAGPSVVAGQALVTDISAKESLGTSLSLFNATPWIGFVIGFSAAGTAMNALGMIPSLILGIALVLMAIVFLIPIPANKPAPLPAL